MKKITMFLAFIVFASITLLHAQTVQLSGTVISADDKTPIPGVTVLVKGTTIGAITNTDGKYSLSIPKDATTLVFTFVGLKTIEVPIGGQTTVDAQLESDAIGLNEVVVTALGITRDKKSIGYATQEVSGDVISTVKSDNFLNSISGEVAGVQVTRTTNIGGSTNVIVRGSTSLTGNNQALFVVDGVPINNTNFNTSDQSQTGAGYDYGNPASDINPSDIESVNILKGAAATALYGSRAAGGVVMITTKKGDLKKKGIGISINSNVTVGFVDKSTFPTYQKDYGAGYGQFDWQTTDDGKTWVATMDDASNGPHFDKNVSYYQWDAVDPESPNYNKATPWVAAKNGPITFFDNPISYTNSVSIENGSDKGAYRLSYTNFSQNGLLPNSYLGKNNFLMNGSWKVTDRLTATGSANLINSTGLGRNSTGYNDNIMTSFRQWFETNVDIKELKDAYFKTKRNVTWNWTDPTSADESPAYWDNPYWIRYENRESDHRNRVNGYFTLDYKLTDWLNVFGRATTDFYTEVQEERKAKGTISGYFGVGSGFDYSIDQPLVGSGYLRRDIFSKEDNYDLMLNFNKNLTEDLNLKGILGGNSRRTVFNRNVSATNSGLNSDRVYSLQNSNSVLVKEYASKIGVDGIYADASLGYKNFLFLEGTVRRDHSSTLPTSHSVYYYPSVSGSLVFSELIHQSWLSFGKFRLNYAEVGSSADFDQLKNEYNIAVPFGDIAMNYVQTTLKNADLKPERTKNIEAGLAMDFLGKRVGFDLTLYKENTVNQILPLAVSKATGYNYKDINAGEIQNKGIELSFKVVPVKISDFQWDMNINWSKNINKVVSLYNSNGDTVTNLSLGSFQGGVTVNATVGKPYGIIQGTDYVYLKGQREVDPTTGDYLSTSTSDQNLGKYTPDWKGGIRNTFTYKNLSLSFLIDIQKGGSIFSCDMYYGLATGLYKETSFTNDLGNPVRDPIVGDATGGYASTSGGYINPGVNPDGTANKTRTEVNPDANGTGLLSFGYYNKPNKAFVYDASYVKLREANITYNLPGSIFKNTFLKGISLSAVGSNLWIIHKNLPYADPESGLGSGNLQGYSIGSLPTTRNLGFDVKLLF
jgi:TonB-linked SusC/RagA family outer membrane protein